MRIKAIKIRPKEERVAEWHRWFAWYPVEVDGKWVWLETLCRRGTFRVWWDADWYEWEYRIID
jgi:hypothetical protein